MGCRVFVGVGGVVALGLAARLGSGKEVPLCKASGHRLAARFQVGRLPLRPLISPTATYVRRCLQAHARTCRGRADLRAVVVHATFQVIRYVSRARSIGTSRVGDKRRSVPVKPPNLPPRLQRDGEKPPAEPLVVHFRFQDAAGVGD